ncbi:tRNA (guanine-N(7)-)-methyltransferase [Anatilimnocola aggregata]|uniref:tRNA (guanine(46)-N(7))-methyltransferase n=1 Tax=Anatilimnocola aggregata TaxID=2528021 RepID=A0A517YL59_9BACT|nr:methyltransferase domain-containing protein [Anatilimnocola aggregata]QDU30965.1 tRNA (guanine-N(7)-)-methyltransferase [Anatilimnocola aggregata]
MTVPVTNKDDDFGVAIPGRILPQEAWAQTAIKKMPDPPLDWQAIFGRSAPVVLDLGCGNGRFLISSSLERPKLNHLGVDILPMVIRYATRRCNQRGLHNARLAVIGAFELLAEYVPAASVAEIHLYHPQPYEKRGHIDDRLITLEFLTLVQNALVPGGLFVIQTDNKSYWKDISRFAPQVFEFEELTGPWPDAPQGRTRREIYARQHGLKIYRGQGTPK